VHSAGNDDPQDQVANRYDEHERPPPQVGLSAARSATCSAGFGSSFTARVYA
jgi:hypothetical protein